jgi:hypothetical protein
MRHRLVATAKARYEGSVAEDVVAQLKELDVADQVMLFGTGMLLSLLPLLILLSAFASERVDDDIALHLGLNNQAAGVTSHLFKTAPASLNAATALSLIFVAAGTVTVAFSAADLRKGLPPGAPGLGVPPAPAGLGLSDVRGSDAGDRARAGGHRRVYRLVGRSHRLCHLRPVFLVVDVLPARGSGWVAPPPAVRRRHRALLRRPWPIFPVLFFVDHNL